MKERQIELAKSILESKGYKVTKVDESTFSQIDMEKEPGVSEQGKEPDTRRGRRPNADLKDDGVFTPGSEEEKDHEGNSEESKDTYTVYYLEKTERGEYYRHMEVSASDKDEARDKAKAKFRNWSNKDIFRIDGIVLKESIQESILKSFNKIHEDTIVESDSKFDEWDPFKGKKYRVSGVSYTDSGEDLKDYEDMYTDDPKEAIEHWFKLGAKFPTEVSILSKTKSDALEVVKSATGEYVGELYDKYGSPYKKDYLVSEAARKVEDGCRGFYEGSYGYGDAIHPFCAG